MKNKLKLLFKALISEGPHLLIYLFFLLFFSFICLLYKINFNILVDLIRYTILPFLIVIIFQVSAKYSQAQTIKRLIKEGNFQQIQLHGFYGHLYAQALQKVMQQKLTENKRLVAALKNREDYLTLWSHEMKTPLTSLLMLAENNATVASEEVSEKIELVNYQLKQLLTFDRLDDFNHDLVFEKIDLFPCLKRVIQENAAFFLAHKVRPQIADSPVKILTDAKWLAFILEQVLINAVKYSSKKGLIQIEFRDDTLTITDHGIGIAASDLPRVFEPGFTGSNGRTHGEATGMGLYMTQRIAKILDIKIEISSTENVGTKVKLRFNPHKITNCKIP
ncbi:sensor histidine kinase [Lactobacillus sp. DCY120]|uniref:histidine kinase n=1 Tax=Bombilactobacillus apium TaxID=2675299 RepID=A0A850QWT7_9LACO|nr:sensor histidine kinase [Bombilactobacillus apium]NVY96274.1 sensor histidine kinase [Bombilactobacillus apium]